jgi:NAD(P)-dependent dehydrogenase (short-subunit alcohol dehydrogenase family)
MTGPAASLRLDGKKALVTGGSRGLGRAIALAFASAGADVAVASRDLAACERVAAEIAALGQDGYARSAHAGHWAELPALVDDCYDRFGRLDVLVNNAGKSPLYDSLPDVSEELFDSVLSLNLKGPFRLAVLVAGRMHADGGGSIINVTSLSAVRPEPRALPYAAAKAGLEVVTAGLAQAYAPTVRVNSIRPGSFATDVIRHWPPEVRERYASGVALRRLGDPAEITGAALYLASDASSFTTGSTISVDGGPA